MSRSSKKGPFVNDKLLDISDAIFGKSGRWSHPPAPLKFFVYEARSMIRRTLRNCCGVRFNPPNLALAASKSIRPRMALATDSGCSKISLSMWCSKRPNVTSLLSKSSTWML